MKKEKVLYAIIITIYVLTLFSVPYGIAQQKCCSDSTCQAEKDKLVILWTTAEKDVFTKVAYMYGLNSKKHDWWKEVILIIWGPSSKLLAEDKELQENIQAMKEEGVTLTACKWCSDEYGVSENLEKMGIDVKYMGKPLTEFIKENRHVMVF